MTNGGIDVSVVVPAYRADATLGQCVASILDQRFDGTFEVIVFTSADSSATVPLLPSDPRLIVVREVPRVPAAPARNRAVGRARGRLIAFTDADVVVPPHWLESLVRASSSGNRCVAGAVRNGTPDSAVGTAEYFVEFSDLAPWRPAAGVWHGATCNLLVPRQVWERDGPFVEDLVAGEDTIFTAPLAALGLLTFAPDAAVVHLNRTTLRGVLSHQFLLGRSAAHVHRRGHGPASRLAATTVLAPVAAAARFVALMVRLCRWAPEHLGRALAVSPLVVAALGAWGAGLAAEGRRLDREARARGPGTRP